MPNLIQSPHIEPFASDRPRRPFPLRQGRINGNAPLVLPSQDRHQCISNRPGVTGAPILETSSSMPAEAPDLSDRDLIAACAQQDRAAFRALYARWGGKLNGVAMRITRDSALAADATHDAFVQVWQQAGRYDPSLGEPGSWLVSLARYRALDLVRRRGREVLGHQPIEEQADLAPDPLSQLLSSADGGALHRCLQTLTEKRRRLVLLAFVEGYSHTQLAERLALPVGTVKSWIRRSLVGLKECLS